MDDAEHRATLVDALTTEHYALQAAVGTAVSESGSRATAFILTVSSSMVALGFTVGTSWVFWPFVSAVLPMLFGLGVVTTVRLVETSLQTLMLQRAIARIRRFYRTLDQHDQGWFGLFSSAHEPDDSTEALAMLASRRRPEYFSSAAGTALITAMIGGIGIALVVVRLAGAEALPIAYLAGIVAVLAQTVAFVLFERARYREALHRPGGDPEDLGLP